MLDQAMSPWLHPILMLLRDDVPKYAQRSLGDLVTSMCGVFDESCYSNPSHVVAGSFGSQRCCHVLFDHPRNLFAMASVIASLALFAMATFAAEANVGTCGPDKPSKVADCGNVDMRSCGNACCKLTFVVKEANLRLL